jgi:hypothetical protein
MVFEIWHKLQQKESVSDQNMALLSTQPLTEMSTRGIS